VREPLIARVAHSAEEMERIGAALAAAVPPLPHGPGILYLEGELGAGKTTLARGFLAARGHTGAVRSPTFTLLETYALGRLTVLHIDLYRLRAPQELEALGLKDFALPEHVWLVEWPERGAGVLPEPDVHIALRVATEGHVAEADARSLLGRAWLAAAADRETAGAGIG